MIRIALLAFVFLFSLSSHSYIPPVDSILEKSISTQKRGGWRVILKTRWLGGGEDETFEEVWTVNNSNSMRLKVRGISESNTHFAMDVVYKNGNRYRVNESGELVFLKMTPHFFERLFHFQKTDDIKEYLKEANILIEETEEEKESNEEASTEEASETQDEEIDPKVKFAYKPSPFVKLSRLGGLVTYKIQAPQSAEASDNLPVPPQNHSAALWVEQDRFHIKKLRLQNKIDLHVDGYEKFGRRFFPKSRKITWRDHKILISTVKIESILIGPKTRKFLEPSSLKTTTKTSDEENESFALSVMTEFYQRFR